MSRLNRRPAAAAAAAAAAAQFLMHGRRAAPAGSPEGLVEMEGLRQKRRVAVRGQPVGPGDAAATSGGPGGGHGGEAGEEERAGAGGGEGGEGGAEGVVAGVEAGAVVGAGGVEPAAVDEEPVAGTSVGTISRESSIFACRNKTSALSFECCMGFSHLQLHRTFDCVYRPIRAAISCKAILCIGRSIVHICIHRTLQTLGLLSDSTRFYKHCMLRKIQKIESVLTLTIAAFWFDSSQIRSFSS